VFSYPLAAGSLAWPWTCPFQYDPQTNLPGGGEVLDLSSHTLLSTLGKGDIEGPLSFQSKLGGQQAYTYILVSVPIPWTLKFLTAFLLLHTPPQRYPPSISRRKLKAASEREV
jgi:hypothetical protein